MIIIYKSALINDTSSYRLINALINRLECITKHNTNKPTNAQKHTYTLTKRQANVTYEFEDYKYYW